MAGKTFDDLVKEAKQKIREVTVHKLAAQLEQNAKPVVLDVREKDDFKQAHIEGAANVPRGEIEMKIDKAVPDKETPIVTYCGGGMRSALAADTLQVMGYDNVASLTGGFKGWKDSGQKIVSES